MIKKQQKWIALLAAFTFMWLLQISTMPLAAANTTEQISAANNEQGPRFVEEEGNSGYRGAKKSSALPIILGVVAVGAIVAVLVLVVFKTSYDITGAWTLTWTYAGKTPGSNTITFTGDKTTGTFVIGASTGTYTVDSKNVTWTYTGGNTVYTGAFTDKTNMNGTMTSYGQPGTWVAIKKAATTSFSNPASTNVTANGERQK